MTTARVDLLVLGARSFIGANVLRAAREAGLRAGGTSRQPKATDLGECDVTEPDQIASILAATRPRCVVNATGVTNTGASAALMRRLHVEGTRALLHAAAKLKPPPRVILYGSSGEYGAGGAGHLHAPIDEDSLCQPHSVYGCSKLAQTQLAADLAPKLGLRVAVLRPFNIVGPEQPVHYAAAAIAQRIERLTSDVLAVADATATRDFVDVRDVAAATIAVAAWPATTDDHHTVLNVATGIETSVLDLARLLVGASGRPIEVVASGTRSSRTSIDRSCGDATRLRARTGWMPRVTLEQSVRDLWNARVVARETAS